MIGGGHLARMSFAYSYTWAFEILVGLAIGAAYKYQ